MMVTRMPGSGVEQEKVYAMQLGAKSACITLQVLRVAHPKRLRSKARRCIEDTGVCALLSPSNWRSCSYWVPQAEVSVRGRGLAGPNG
jgi:hypothetical protein